MYKETHVRMEIKEAWLFIWTIVSFWPKNVHMYCFMEKSIQIEDVVKSYKRYQSVIFLITQGVMSLSSAWSSLEVLDVSPISNIVIMKIKLLYVQEVSFKVKNK